MITKERLAEIRKTFHPHELDVVTIEALDTIEALLRENEEMKQEIKRVTEIGYMELDKDFKWVDYKRKLERVAEAAEKQLKLERIECRDWFEIIESLLALRGKP